MAGGLSSHAPMLAALVCALSAATGAAQTLRDPARPALMLGAKATADPVQASAWIVQSVLISPERRYAIINGEVVALGGSIAGAELVGVAEERVTLRTREGLRVFRLFPDVTRRGAADAGPGAAKRMPAPQAETNTEAQKSGRAGIKK